MLPTLSPEETYQRLQQGEIRLIDIRETNEYAGVSIPGSRLVPLSVIARHPLKDADAPDKPIVFFCHSGNRTSKNADLLERRAAGVPAYQREGGIEAWEKAGLPVERGASTMPLFRQIQIAAGSLILIGALGSLGWHPLLWLAVFGGAGLVFAGITGFCGLGVLLSRMPWNRS